SYILTYISSTVIFQHYIALFPAIMYKQSKLYLVGRTCTVISVGTYQRGGLRSRFYGILTSCQIGSVNVCKHYRSMKLDFKITSEHGEITRLICCNMCNTLTWHSTKCLASQAVDFHC